MALIFNPSFDFENVYCSDDIFGFKKKLTLLRYSLELASLVTTQGINRPLASC
jgi:hypothetical protein